MSSTFDAAFQEFFPALKWVRGEPLSPENWIELFRIVKLPPGTTLEKLTFGDLLAVADEIAKNVTVLKVRMAFSYNTIIAG